MTQTEGQTHPSARPKEEEQQRQLSPVARNALAALIAVIVVVNLFVLMKRLGPPTPADSTAKLRAAGPAIPVYRAREGETHIHMLKPGTSVPLGDVDRIEGPRYPVHVTVDETTVVEGFIDAKDLEPGELDRVKRVLQGSR